MAKYIGKRLIHLIGIMIAVSFLTFLLMYLSPGDAAAKKLKLKTAYIHRQRFIFVLPHRENLKETIYERIEVPRKQSAVHREADDCLYVHI